MHLNHKIEIDLLQVFKAGKFDYLKIGQTREWILRNFPEPDDYQTGHTIYTACFWNYGNITLFFDGDLLSQISSAHIDSLDSGEKIHLDKWILDGSVSLTLENVTRHLVKERINFQVKHFLGEYVCQTSVGLLDSFVHLAFQPEDIETDNYEQWFKTDRKKINPNKHVLSSLAILAEEDMKLVLNTL